jgi:hypothetical protein
MFNGLFHSFNLREGNMALGQCYMNAPLGHAQAREAAQRRQVSLREEERDQSPIMSSTLFFLGVSPICM